MKKVLSILAITAAVAVVMAACKGNNTADTQKISYDDTVGFAQFQQWKAMNERVDPSLYGYGTAATAVPVAKKAKTRSVSSSSGTMSSSSTHTAQTTTKKKGWSKAAKYAAIGGGGGAVLGAVVNKRNRVAGGVVGAVLGGGLGYVLGRHQDKKDGRY